MAKYDALTAGFPVRGIKPRDQTGAVFRGGFILKVRNTVWMEIAQSGEDAEGSTQSLLALQAVGPVWATPVHHFMKEILPMMAF